MASSLATCSRSICQQGSSSMRKAMPSLATRSLFTVARQMPATGRTSAITRLDTSLNRVLISNQSRCYSDRREDKAKDRNAVGPFNLRAAALFVVTGAGLFIYFRREKAAMEERKRLEQSQQKIGRPKIGGPFELIMPTPIQSLAEAKKVEGRRFAHEDLQNSFSLIYFGFTNCPDICPEELDKMAQIVDSVDAKHGPVINPVFITCDPARDSLAATSIYVAEFHPRLIGLTGAYEAVKEACKAYRVYFSTPPGADPSGDYLVDHSIFFYLMDPDGKFVDAFGRSVNAEEATTKVLGYIEKWKESGNAISEANAKERVLKDETRRV